MMSGHSWKSHSCRSQDLLPKTNKKTKPTLWTTAFLHMKPGLWASQDFWRSTYVCVQIPIPSPCLLFRREHAHMAQCKVPVCLQLSWETWHDVRPLVSFWAWTAFLLHFTWQGEHLAKPSPSSAHAGWFHSEAAITQTGMWSGHVSDTFISFTSRRFSNE